VLHQGVAAIIVTLLPEFKIRVDNSGKN